MASQWARLSCAMGEAGQDARLKLAAPVPPSARPLLASAGMLGRRSATLGQSSVGANTVWETADLLSSFHALAGIDPFPKGHRGWTWQGTSFQMIERSHFYTL